MEFFNASFSMALGERFRLPKGNNGKKTKQREIIF